jgi:hypothetical protein
VSIALPAATAVTLAEWPAEGFVIGERITGPKRA